MAFLICNRCQDNKKLKTKKLYLLFHLLPFIPFFVIIFYRIKNSTKNIKSLISFGPVRKFQKWLFRLITTFTICLVDWWKNETINKMETSAPYEYNMRSANRYIHRMSIASSQLIASSLPTKINKSFESWQNQFMFTAYLTRCHEIVNKWSEREIEWKRNSYTETGMSWIMKTLIQPKMDLLPHP